MLAAWPIRPFDWRYWIQRVAVPLVATLSVYRILSRVVLWFIRYTAEAMFFVHAMTICLMHRFCKTVLVWLATLVG
jgi:hypothetical protein